VRKDSAIEELEEQAHRLREEDEEAKLRDLTTALLGPMNDEWYPPPVPRRARAIRENEFMCSHCHLVLHRSLLGDRERRLCIYCSHALVAPLVERLPRRRLFSIKEYQAAPAPASVL
jgi:hypothetical protein